MKFKDELVTDDSQKSMLQEMKELTNMKEEMEITFFYVRYSYSYHPRFSSSNTNLSFK